MTLPVVSVIMANHNGERYLAPAIASVLAQTLHAWELIVVDDASTDGSVAILRQAAAQDSRIRLLVQPENRGPGAARNLALGQARGQWVAIFDSDDVMAPQRLERMVARANDDNALIVADNQKICSSDLTPRELYLSSEPKTPVWVDLAAFVESSRLYSRVPDLGFLKPLICSAAIARVGARYDEHLRIGEDFHFLLKLLAAGMRIRIEPEPLYFYRKHVSSTSHRLSPDAVLAIQAADDAFLRKGVPLDLAAARAFRRRRAGLRSWLAYDRTLRALKAGRLIEAGACAIQRPHAWRLMMEPIRARLSRLVERLSSQPAGSRP